MNLKDLLSGGGPDAIKEAIEAFETIASSLSSVTDEASAAEAGPRIDQANDTLSGLAEKLEGLPGPIRNQISGKVAEYVDRFDKLVEQVSAIPGVAGIIQPYIDKVRATINQFVG